LLPRVDIALFEGGHESRSRVARFRELVTKLLLGIGRADDSISTRRLRVRGKVVGVVVDM